MGPEQSRDPGFMLTVIFDLSQLRFPIRVPKSAVRNLIDGSLKHSTS